MVVRGGFGLFYTLPNANSVLQTLGGQPFVSSASLSGTANAAATFQTPYTTVLTPGVWRPRSTAYTLTVTGVAENIDSPLVEQYNLNVEQQLPANFVLEMGYVGTRGTRLAESRALNRAFLASPSNPINGVTTNTVASANLQARVPYQGFTPGGVTRIETYGFSNFNSMQATLKTQMSHGVYSAGCVHVGPRLDDSNWRRWHQRRLRRRQRQQQRPEQSLCTVGALLVTTARIGS